MVYGLKSEKNIILVNQDSDCNLFKKIISPVIVDGAAVGSVIFLSPDDRKKFSECEIKMLQFASNYLENELE
jgi:AbrB family transcriptional regulator (stage V sporulation protein T)